MSEREREREREGGRGRVRDITLRCTHILHDSKSSGANVNTRDFGGRRPIDIISNKTTERSRGIDDPYHNIT